MLSRKLENRTVKIKDVFACEYIGEVLDYIFPKDNEPEGIAGINVKLDDGSLVGLNETDIEHIEVIK